MSAPRPAHRVCTLAGFTQPERGYLRQLIMPPFMHINEPGSDSAGGEDKHPQPNGKPIPGPRPESHRALSGDFPCLASRGARVLCGCCDTSPQTSWLKPQVRRLRFWGQKRRAGLTGLQLRRQQSRVPFGGLLGHVFLPFPAGHLRHSNSGPQLRSQG